MKEKESKCGTFNNNILCLHGDWSQSLKYTTCGLRRVNDNTHRYVSIFISHIYTHFVKKQHGSGKHKLRAMAQLPRIQPQWLRQRSRPQMWNIRRWEFKQRTPSSICMRCQFLLLQHDGTLGLRANRCIRHRSQTGWESRVEQLLYETLTESCVGENADIKADTCWSLFVWSLIVFDYYLTII